MDLVSKKVLIIGIESFTGKHLSKYLLNNGFDIYGTSLHNINSDYIYQCDISDKSSIKNIIEKIKPDYIMNLAGISFVGNSKRELFYRINVLAVENILEACLEISNYSPSKIILASSATIYGNQNSDILDESMNPNPVNHYGISKLAMEQLAKTYFDKLNIIITRPFNYTGVGQEEHFLIPKIVFHFKDNKKEIELGNMDVYREFNDVEYVCEIYTRLLLSDINSEIVNICSNRVIALKKVIEMMNEIAGYQIQIRVNPKFVRENEIVSLSGSVDNLYSLIGEVEQIEFDRTLEKMYKD